MVRFGAQLEKISAQTYRSTSYVVNYEQLKQVISLVHNNVSVEGLANVRVYFEELLIGELGKINRYMEVEIQTWMQQARIAGVRATISPWTASNRTDRPADSGAESQIDDSVSPGSAAAITAEFHRQLKELGARLVELDTYRRINVTAFQKIAKKFDKEHGRARSKLQAQIDQTASSTSGEDAVVSLAALPLGASFMRTVRKASFLSANLDWMLAALALKWEQLRRTSRGPRPRGYSISTGSSLANMPGLSANMPPNTNANLFPDKTPQMAASARSQSPSVAGTAEPSSNFFTARQKYTPKSVTKRSDVSENDVMTEISFESAKRRNNYETRRFSSSVPRRIELLVSLVEKMRIIMPNKSAFDEVVRLVDSTSIMEVPSTPCPIWDTFHWEAVARSGDHGQIRVTWSSRDFSDIPHVRIDMSLAEPDEVIFFGNSSDDYLVTGEVRKVSLQALLASKLGSDAYKFVVSRSLRVRLRGEGTDEMIAVDEDVMVSKRDFSVSATGFLAQLDMADTSDDEGLQVADSQQQEATNRVPMLSGHSFRALVVWNFDSTRSLDEVADEVAVKSDITSLLTASGPSRKNVPLELTHPRGAVKDNLLSPTAAAALCQLLQLSVTAPVLQCIGPEDWLLQVSAENGLTCIDAVQTLPDLAHCLDEQDGDGSAAARLTLEPAVETDMSSLGTQAKLVPLKNYTASTFESEGSIVSPEKRQAAASLLALKYNALDLNYLEERAAMPDAGRKDGDGGVTELDLPPRPDGDLDLRDDAKDPFVSFHDPVRMPNSVQTTMDGTVTIYVKPKSYLANERTLIQWVEVSVMLFIVGLVAVVAGRNLKRQVEIYTKLEAPNAALTSRRPDYAQLRAAESEASAASTDNLPVIARHPIHSPQHAANTSPETSENVRPKATPAGPKTAGLHILPVVLEPLPPARPEPKEDPNDNDNAKRKLEDKLKIGLAGPELRLVESAAGTAEGFDDSYTDSTQIPSLSQNVTSVILPLLLQKLQEDIMIANSSCALGFSMISVALAGMWWGYYMFRKRLRCIDDNEFPGKHFCSRAGPLLYTTGLILLLLANFML